jgi:hypothetical protein
MNTTFSFKFNGECTSSNGVAFTSVIINGVDLNNMNYSQVSNLKAKVLVEVAKELNTEVLFCCAPINDARYIIMQIMHNAIEDNIYQKLIKSNRLLS